MSSFQFLTQRGLTLLCNFLQKVVTHCYSGSRITEKIQNCLVSSICGLPEVLGARLRLWLTLPRFKSEESCLFNKYNFSCIVQVFCS